MESERPGLRCVMALAPSSLQSSSRAPGPSSFRPSATPSMLNRETTESMELATRKVAPFSEGSTASPTIPRQGAGRSVRVGTAPLSGFLCVRGQLHHFDVKSCTCQSFKV